MAVVCFATALTGCGKKKVVNNIDVFEGLQDIDKEHIFKKEDLSGILDEAGFIEYFDYAGNKIKIVCSPDTGDEYKYVTMNPDGTDVSVIDLAFEEGTTYNAFVSDDSGNLYVAYTVYSDADFNEIKETGILKLDNTGNEVARANLTSVLSEEDYFIYKILWTPASGVIFSTSKGIAAFDGQNSANIIIDTKAIGDKVDDYGIELYKGAGNQVFVSYYDKKEKQHLAKLDLENKSVGKESSALEDSKAYSFSGGEGCDLYAQDDQIIYGYDAKADKFTELLNLTDSEIGGKYNVANFVAVSDRELVALMYDGDTSFSLARLTKIDPQDIVDKTIITMGGVYIEPETVANTVEFNSNSDKYKIKVIDYADYYDENPEEHFRLDITMGKVPDIFCINSYTSADIESFINKGLMMDLSPAFEKGGALGGIEVLPNIYEMMKTNGKVYTVIPSFSVNTFVIRDRFAGGKTSLTLSECDELIKSNNTDYRLGFELCDRNYFVLNGVSYGGDTFVDWKNKKCNFNSPEFIDLLNFANNLPEDVDGGDDDFQSFSAELYADDRAIFCNTFLNDFYSYGELKQVTFNDDVAFIGFPNNSGKNEACVYPNMQYCVSSGTKSADAAFAYIKSEFANYKLTEKRALLFPSDKAMFEADMKAATQERSEEDAIYFSTGSADVEAKPLTQEDAQKLYDYILTVNNVYRFDPKLEQIISEEISAFFKGQKSAEKVAELVQNRVTTYLNEKN
ncbi:MAG: hypothetical protein J5802_07280 [Butyrivibrio sp.]|nr:hypothetical protein [Butyrivibrio sp.]